MKKYLYSSLVIYLIYNVSSEKCDNIPSASRLGSANAIKVKRDVENVRDFDQLISQNTSRESILENYKKDWKVAPGRRFDTGLILTYVSPWTIQGYELVKKFSNKFSHVSPAWLGIEKISSGEYEITGTEYIDKDWMDKLKNGSTKPKIVPRVLFDAIGEKDFAALFQNTKEIRLLAKTLARFAKHHHFDGFVLEIWPQVRIEIEYDPFVNLIKEIGDFLAKRRLDAILVIPPKRNGKLSFSQEHFEKLFEHVTAFSLTSYDYPKTGKPDANAPLTWMEDTIRSICPSSNQRSKIFTGLNFYGYHYLENEGGQHIFSDEYVTLLEQNTDVQITYDPKTAEHSIQYKDSNGTHLIFYPTLYSLQKRIDLCKKLGTGIAIWDLGEGLDYFPIMF